MHISFRTSVLLVWIIGCASVADAALIVGTEPEGNGGYGVGFSFDPNVNLTIAQQIQLSQPVVADSITVYLNGDGSINPQGNFTLQVMDQIGPGATSADVLLTEVGAFPSGFLPTGHAPVTFGGLALALNAGTYYLVVSSAAGPGTGWGSGASVLPSALGTVGATFVGIVTGGPVADYTSFDLNNPSSPNTNFRIDMVPEPTSLALSLTAMVGLLGWSWWRRRSRVESPR